MISNRPKFSIVVPSYQQAEFLSLTIASLLAQSYPNFEIIVVDGGSTDGSVGILEQFGDQIVWVSEKDDGQSDAIAKGFSIASGEWLSWLNSDDVLLEGALESISGVISQNQDAEVIVGRANYIDENGNYLRDYPTIDLGEGKDTLDQLFNKGYMAQPSTYFSRDAYLSIGGIDKTFSFAMDYDLWVRFAKAGKEFIGIDKELSSNRWHDSAKTSSNLLFLLAEVVKIQIREFGVVSPYFVQAISDNLYSILHSSVRGDKAHLIVRNFYYKSVWLWLNYAGPRYCIKGLIFSNISKTDPIVGDELSFGEILKYSIEYIKKEMLRKMQLKDE